MSEEIAGKLRITYSCKLCGVHSFVSLGTSRPDWNTEEAMREDAKKLEEVLKSNHSQVSPNCAGDFEDQWVRVSLVENYQKRPPEEGEEWKEQ